MLFADGSSRPGRKRGSVRIPKRLSYTLVREICVICGAICGALLLRPYTWAGEFELNGRRYSLPDGFSLEQVAGPPLVDRPICADFDEQGRLYVAESSGANDDVETQLKERPHRILRLEDTDGDGHFDQSVVFADRMMFPSGTLWYDGSLYVAAPPSIWKLTDTDGDDVADQREEWFEGKTLTGCANDLHGPYLGLDGWIYWCKGAFAEQTYERPGRTPFVTRAAHIFRRRPQGGVVEPVMSGGMDNPIEVIFTPGGERIFTTTFLKRPGDGQRDGLIHAIYGGVYGKVYGVIEGHPRTGPLMPVLVHTGASAPCGLTRLASDAFGEGFRDNLFATHFNLHKVSRHVLEPSGATFRTRDQDFLTCDDLDFHPTDVLEDADGSLLVIDTGGWYKLCCPTSQLWKPDVLGAIYRVRRAGGHQVADPVGREVDCAGMPSHEVAKLLGDGRPFVRRRAQRTLADRGRDALPSVRDVLTTSSDPRVRVRAVWTLTRIADAAARRAVRAALRDSHAQVRQAAVHSVSVWRDAEATPELSDLLANPSLHNRRAAAEALGRIGDRRVVPKLLAAAAEWHDRTLEHSLIFALIEIAAPQATREGLTSDSEHVRRAVLVALDQMEGGDLTAEDVGPRPESAEDVLRETGWWLAERHPEWAGSYSSYFRDRIAHRPPENLELLSSRLARFAASPAIQSVIVEGLRDPTVALETRVALLGAMARSGLGEIPEPWSAELLRLLSSKNPRLLENAISTAHALAGQKHDAALKTRLTSTLVTLSRDPELPGSVRLEAAAAASSSGAPLDPAAFRFLCAQLANDKPPRERSLAVDALLAAKLRPGELETLAEALATTGPSELRRLLAAFDGRREEEFGVKLIAALKRCPAVTSVPLDELKSRLAPYGGKAAEEAKELYAQIARETVEKRKELESVLALLEKADVRRGQRVFHSTKAACSTCHAVGYVGGRVGPGLRRIGDIRSDRDLLEAILFPSASFVRSYEPVVIVTTRGEVISGVLRDETEHQLTLVIDAQKVRSIPVAEIQQREFGSVSIMPAGLDKQLTSQELADLVHFLKVAW